MTTVTPGQTAPHPPAHRRAPARRARTMTPQHYEQRAQEAAVMAETKKNPNLNRIGGYFDEDQAGRVRASYVAWLSDDHSGTLSDYIKSLVMADVERRESDTNGGRPFDPIPANAVRMYTHQQIADKKRADADS
ncbi:MAG: ParB family protein [Stackebrandtia sp.]